MTRHSAADKLPVAWMRKVEIIETPSEKEGTYGNTSGRSTGHRHTAVVTSTIKLLFKHVH